jgi:hypothetical protein
MFEGTKGGFADREIRRSKDHGANPGCLFYCVGRLTDPPALLLVTGRAEIFVFIQPSVGPSVRSQLVPAVMTVPDQIGIGFCETAGEEDCSRETVSVTQVEEQFESRVRAGHPIAVNRKVKLRGSGLVMPVPIGWVLTVAVTQSHYGSLFRVTDASSVCSGDARWSRMGEISPT